MGIATNHRQRLAWTAGALAASSLLALAPGVASATAPGAGPIASWSFDEPAGQLARDDQGLADGVLGRLPGPDPADPQRVAGVAGGALLFDGDDRVTLPDRRALEPPRLSITAWVRRAGSPGAYRYILSKGGSECFASAYGLYSGAQGGLAFYVADGARFAVTPTAAAADVWDGRWHAVAGTFDGTLVRLYLDDREIGSGTPAPPGIVYPRASRAPFIGTYVGSCELPWSGEIDEVALWPGPLDTAQVRALAMPPAPASVPVTGDPAPPPVPGPLAGAAPAPRLPTRCVSVTLAHSVAVLRRSVRVVIRVRSGGRPLQRTVVRLRGAGVRRAARTARDGRVRLRIRPTVAAAIAVTVAGRVTCDPARITVRRR